MFDLVFGTDRAQASRRAISLYEMAVNSVVSVRGRAGLRSARGVNETGFSLERISKDLVIIFGLTSA